MINGALVAFGRQAETILSSVSGRSLADNGAPPYKFAYARTALKYGMASLGFAPGDSLLMPDFICESILESLDELGVAARYYPVDSRLRPIWNEVEQSIDETVKGFLVVHYFGQPQDIGRCRGFCDDHGIFMIEDNAHGHGGTLDGQMLGTFGAIGISSPRKSFPIPNGAYLFTDRANIDTVTLRLQAVVSDSRIAQARRWMRDRRPIGAALALRRQLAGYLGRFSKVNPYGSQDSFRSRSVPLDYGMDESIHSFLAQQDIAAVGERRRTIYRLWSDWAVNQGLDPVFPEQSAGALPLVFPAYSASREESLEWYARGHRAGVDIYSWPTFPREIVERDGNAMRLWERLVCFPIHQGMDPSLLEKRLTSI